jgi:hypothetical protein
MSETDKIEQDIAIHLVRYEQHKLEMENERDVIIRLRVQLSRMIAARNNPHITNRE